MSDEVKKKKGLGFPKSFLLALILAAVLLGMVLWLFPTLGLPGWPFTFFLWYFVSIARLQKDKLLVTAVGGFIGLTVSFCPALIGYFTGDIGIGWIVFLVLLVLLIAFIIDGRMKVVEHLCMLMITALLPPGLGVELPIEKYLPAVVTYAITVAIFTILVLILSNNAKKKAVNTIDKKNAANTAVE
jgi:hypothetical protein